MAYTIVKSNGQVLTTIPDGTINTSSTSLGLPGRNYAGYGQYLDTNFVHMMENFADTAPPANPLQGQLWYNTNANTLYVCPADGTANANAWLALTSTSGGGTTTFGAVTITGNLSSNNATITNAISADTITVRLATVTDLATIANANVTTANIGTTNTTTISAGSQSTSGTLTGVWTANGSGTANSVAGTSMWITGGNLVITGGASLGIRTDNYYYANGTPISFAGTYNNGNVFDYLTGSNAVSRFGGAIAVSSATTANITTGASGTAGQLTGNWTLSSGSRLNATYADLAERFEADAYYDAGTVVELGGDKEITAVQYELSEDVFGVISDTAAYLMNSGAGTNDTHPPVAMTGRVQVKVMGIVKKGDRLVSAGNGIARAAKKGEANAFNTIGRSLANKTDEQLGTVLATVVIAR
jgi:hypothetical protein